MTKTDSKVDQEPVVKHVPTVLKADNPRAILNSLNITQSMMKDWTGGMCPPLFKARWFDKTYEWTESEAMLWGNWFEYEAIGANVRDGSIPELTDKMKKSVTYGRAQQQLEMWHKIVKELNITDIEVQQEVEAVIEFTYDGQVFPVRISGTEDLRCKVDGKPTIIDIKTTGSVKNTYGDYAWGNPDSMDLKQAIHYPMIEQITTGVKHDFLYIVFGLDKDMGCKIIQGVPTEQSFDKHQQKIFMMWNEIAYSLFNTFEPDPSYNKCNGCPFPCVAQQTVPEITQVEI